MTPISYTAPCARNILVETSGMARLLQFPLVTAISDRQRREPPLVDYLAPELAAADQAPTPESDLYGLGCTLYELIAGHPPFAGGTPQQKIARHRGDDALPLDQVQPDVSSRLADLVAEMLAKDPSLRSPSAARVAHRLKTFAADATAAQRLPEAQATPAATLVATPDEPAAVLATAQNPAPLVVAEERPTAVIRPRRGAPQDGARRRGAALCVVLGLAVAVLVNMRGDTTEVVAAAKNNPSTLATDDPNVKIDEAAVPVEPDAVEPPGPLPETAGGESVHLVDDDGHTLWASPTAGQPIDLSYLPSGGQVFLVIRPKDLFGSTEGNRLVDALGPGGRWAQDNLRATLGVEPTDIEQLTIAFVPDASLVTRTAYVIHLSDPVPKQLLLAEWGRPAAARHEGETYYEKAGQGYYLPVAGGDRIAAIAPVEMIKQMIELRGKPLLRSGIEALVKHSDDQRQFTLLFTPSYLFTDGRELFVGHLQKLRSPLGEFLGKGIEAVMFSAHTGEELFVELRTTAPLKPNALELMTLLRSRWDGVPERVENYVTKLDPHPYGRLVIHRFPRMLQLARDYTRAGIDDGQVVLRAYLPNSAAHNLVLGTELVLLESPGVTRVVQSASPAAPPRSVADKLREKVTLSFGREPLDRAIELLSNELGVEIVIEGSDLQLEGITKNQSLNNFDERDKPADDILRTVLKLANSDGKLVYVIAPGAGWRGCDPRHHAGSRRETRPTAPPRFLTRL